MIIEQFLPFVFYLQDTKFAVAETKTLGRMAVFSRLKRDYATLSKKGGKVTSSYDQRISLTIPKDCIRGKDHILMEVCRPICRYKFGSLTLIKCTQECWLDKFGFRCVKFTSFRCLRALFVWVCVS